MRLKRAVRCRSSSAWRPSQRCCTVWHATSLTAMSVADVSPARAIGPSLLSILLLLLLLRKCELRKHRCELSARAFNERV